MGTREEQSHSGVDDGHKISLRKQNKTTWMTMTMVLSGTESGCDTKGCFARILYQCAWKCCSTSSQASVLVYCVIAAAC